MSTRARIPPEVQDAVLLKCARRCALCVGLHNDLEVKSGQLAHIDRDPERAGEDDLAFLCLAHHDAYDSQPSQSKGWRPGELRAYKADLERRVTKDPSLRPGEASERLHKRIAHDRRMFVAVDRQMTETQLEGLIHVLGSDDSYTDADVRPVDGFLVHSGRTENAFLDARLRERSDQLASCLRDLLRFLALQFFVFPRNQARNDLRKCLKPSWNVDRDGDGNAESMPRYDELQRTLDGLLRATGEAYRSFRLTVKEVLML